MEKAQAKTKKSAGKYPHYEGKQHANLMMVTAKWPCSFESRLMWSHLVAAARVGEGLTPAEVTSRTGLDESKTVPRCRKCLLEKGLIRVEDGVMFAEVPGERQGGWLHFFESKYGGTALDSMKYVKTLVREPSCPLSQRQVAMYSLLLSYANGNNYALGLSKQAIATSLPASRQTVQDGLVELETQGLIKVHPSRDGRRFAFKLPKPTATQLSWFRDTAATRYAKPEEYPGFVLEEDDQEEEEAPEEPQTDEKSALVEGSFSDMMKEEEVEEDDYEYDEEYLKDPVVEAMLKHDFSMDQVDECFNVAATTNLTRKTIIAILKKCHIMKYDYLYNCYSLFLYRLKSLPKRRKKKVDNATDIGRRDDDRPSEGGADTGKDATVPSDAESSGRSVGEAPDPEAEREHATFPKAPGDEVTPAEPEKPVSKWKGIFAKAKLTESTGNDWLDEHPWDKFTQEEDE